MKKTISRLKLFIPLLIIMILSCRQTQTKDLIIGKWQFEKFISETNESEISIEEAKMIKDANKANEGLFMSFTSDNKFKTEQRGGMDINNSSGNYKLVGDKIIVMMTDSIQIIQLDKYSLKLYNKGRPIIVFKR